MRETNLLIVWHDVYSEKWAPTTSVVGSQSKSWSNANINCGGMEVVEIRRELFGRKRRKEMR